jgi:homoserine dehydrogenase
MKDVRLALIGFGNVAQGMTQILLDQGEAFAKQAGINITITAITDPIKGNAFNPEGLSPAELLEAVKQPEALNTLPGKHPEWDAMEMIQNVPADVVVEMSYTDLHTGEPASTYIAEALQRKKHVITTNKGPIALHYDRLASLAHLHHVQLGVEGTVMSGTPTLRVGKEILAAAGIQRIQGILNGTTNFILTEMENGRAYEDALADAQRLGYAEANPAGDVEGYDAAGKVAILARLVMQSPVDLNDVERQGITQITPEQIASARARNQVWKLVGTVERTADGVNARVRPECLDAEHPLARIKDVTNAVLFTTDLLGDVTIIGPGAGRSQTGFAIIQDLFAIYGIRPR